MYVYYSNSICESDWHVPNFLLILIFTGMTSRLRNTAGAITLSKDGDVGVHFSSKRMSWAYVKEGKIFYGIEPGEILQEKYDPKNC